MVVAYSFVDHGASVDQGSYSVDWYIFVDCGVAVDQGSYSVGHNMQVAWSSVPAGEE